MRKTLLATILLGLPIWAIAEWKLNPYTQRQDYYEATAGVKVSTGALYGLVSAEESARIAADATLTSDLATEISNRIAADLAIGASTASIYSLLGSTAAALTAETAARIAADSAIGVTTASLRTDLGILAASTGPLVNYANWNTAYGWGNHASAGYASASDVGSATDTLRTDLTATNVSTGTIYSALNSTGAALSAHEALTTSAHGGIASSTQLTSTAAALSAHTALTTTAHGGLVAVEVDPFYTAAASTIAATNKSNTFTSSQTFTSASGLSVTGDYNTSSGKFITATGEVSVGGASTGYGFSVIKPSNGMYFGRVSDGQYGEMGWGTGATPSVNWYQGLRANTYNMSWFSYGAGGAFPLNIGYSGGVMINGTDATATARAALDVTGSGYFTGGVNAVGQITGSTGTFTGNAFSVGGSTLVVSGGKVGVGVSPTSLFHVGGAGAFNTTLAVNGGLASGAQFSVGTTTMSIRSGSIVLGSYGGESGTGTVEVVRNETDAATRPYAFVISNASNLGTFRQYSPSGHNLTAMYNASGVATHQFYSNGNSYINTGNVGIGTTAPGSKLEVNGDITATSSGTFLNSNFNIGTSTGVVFKTHGYGAWVGIGTGTIKTADEELLNIKGDISNITFDRGFRQRFWRDGANELYVGGGSSGRLNFNEYDGTARLMVGLGGVSMGTYAEAENTPPANGLIVSGNVGIGTTAPGSKLEVNGNVTASSFTATGNGFVGNGSSITYISVFASSHAVDGTSIASTNYVQLATATITARGTGYTRLILYDVDIVNGAGGSRVYTLNYTLNGVTMDTHDYTCSGTDACHINDHHMAASTAGTINVNISIKSSNATGTQTVNDAKISIVEY